MAIYALFLLFSLVFSQENHEHTEPEDNTVTDRAELMKEWNEYMNDFVPADMMTFDLPARAEEDFIETIDIIPSYIRGAYFISSRESKDVNFYILDPSGKQVFLRIGKAEAIFHFDAAVKGQYIFRFKNTKMMQSHTVTFAVHCGNSTEDPLTAEHLTPLEKDLLTVQSSVKDFQVDQQFATLRQESHHKTVAASNINLLIFSVVESIFVVFVSFWQAYYIKKLLDNRRVL
ncbi:unnamed protein product [Blepharisma stoltei]|uniref:GOLD domain-containing protein n=1 Tax=Blepharisma stoltei TaxID=1481888 RepID=A0AAU9JM15_9CILI|nr:unnamed protein product [Blepharisma stoltei]